MTSRRLLFGSALTVMLALPLVGRADVKLPAIFGDNMALQAETPIPVWGTADPGEKVEVRVSVPGVPAEQAKQATADNQGRWKLVLDPLPVTEEPIGFSVAGKNRISLNNVITGDVWVASGQSNMEFSVARSNNPEAEIASANFPSIRLFLVKKSVEAEAPAADVVGKWVVCTPETIPGFSAVAFFFARELQATTGRPFGLIGTYWGGTPAESWTSREKLESDERFAPILTRWAEIDKKAAEGTPDKSRQGALGPKHPHHPAGLFNGMVAPIVPFAIKGAIWYQGESNATRAYQYRDLFPAMITDWRAQWGQGDFPFLFVQLANYYPRKDQPDESNWAELREAQSMALSLPATGQAVIVDIGDAGDIHPTNKQDVGKRLALSALKVAYGRNDVVYSGPTYDSVSFADGKATLSFKNIGGGLEAKGDALKGFAVAGEDRVFKWADAAIENGKIVVSSKEVPKPVAVRYAWADNPEATLYNAEGLPASPFRTDDWPGMTMNNK